MLLTRRTLVIEPADLVAGGLHNVVSWSAPKERQAPCLVLRWATTLPESLVTPGRRIPGCGRTLVDPNPVSTTWWLACVDYWLGGVKKTLWLDAWGGSVRLPPCDAVNVDIYVLVPGAGSAAQFAFALAEGVGSESGDRPAVFTAEAYAAQADAVTVLYPDTLPAVLVTRGSVPQVVAVEMYIAPTNLPTNGSDVTLFDGVASEAQLVDDGTATPRYQVPVGGLPFATATFLAAGIARIVCYQAV